MTKNGFKTVPVPATTDGKPAKNPLELKLNHRQELFVAEYLVHLDATKAALSVGYSERSAKQIGAENLAKPHIKAAIASEIEKRKAKLEVNAQAVINELALIGFADMSDFIEIDEGGAVRAFPLTDLPKGKSRIIKKVKDKRVIRTTKGTETNPDGDQILDATYEFELHDKVKSLELLSRHLGLLHDKTEVDLKVPITIQIIKFTGE